MKAFNNFYKNKRILITGHTGFKGGWLSLWLSKLGAQVCGYALAPEGERQTYEDLNVAQYTESHYGDVCDYEQLCQVSKDFDPEIIFHLAAQSLVRTSYEQPIDTVATNVLGTAHVLEVARLTPSLKSVIIVTSDKCYENLEQVQSFRETDPMGGSDLYSASKGAAEIITAAYYRSFFKNNLNAAVAHVGIASVRAGNVIGGADWSVDRIVPDYVRAQMAGCPLQMRNPAAVRPWQYVLEPLSGYLHLASYLYEQPERYSGAWNFGPSYSQIYSVKELIESLDQHWIEGTTYEISSTEKDRRMAECEFLKVDSTKANSQLNWHSTYSFEDCMSETALWYKKYLESGSDIFQTSSEQIDRFTAQAKERNILWAKEKRS